MRTFWLGTCTPAGAGTVTLRQRLAGQGEADAAALGSLPAQGNAPRPRPVSRTIAVSKRWTRMAEIVSPGQGELLPVGFPLRGGNRVNARYAAQIPTPELPCRTGQRRCRPSSPFEHGAPGATS